MRVKNRCDESYLRIYMYFNKISMFSDRTKFNEILQKEDVKVSYQGDICLNDFIHKIVGSKKIDK